MAKWPCKQFGSCYLVCSCVRFCLHSVESAFGFVFECVITTDCGIQYCTERVNEEKKGGGCREDGQTREKMNLLPPPPPTPPPPFSSDELAWWHVVWKAMSSAICVSLLPLVRVTLWLPGSKSLCFFALVVAFIRSRCTHTSSSSCLLAKQIYGL